MIRGYALSNFGPKDACNWQCLLLLRQQSLNNDGMKTLASLFIALLASSGVAMSSSARTGESSTERSTETPSRERLNYLTKRIDTRSPKIDCPNENFLIGKTRFRSAHLSADKCYFSVSINRFTDLVYRQYLFTTNGLLMVFNSFGSGPESTDTGAREYYFFPRDHDIQLKVDPTMGLLQLRLINGDMATFDIEAASLDRLDLGQVFVDPEIVQSNQGGVEIKRYSGLLLDSGFKLGSSPSSKPNRESKFTDAGGRTCVVKNSEIFKYPGGETAFKFSDQELKEFLAGRCPQINWNF